RRSSDLAYLIYLKGIVNSSCITLCLIQIGKQVVQHARLLQTTSVISPTCMHVIQHWPLYPVLHLLNSYIIRSAWVGTFRGIRLMGATLIMTFMLHWMNLSLQLNTIIWTRLNSFRKASPLILVSQWKCPV